VIVTGAQNPAVRLAVASASRRWRSSDKSTAIRNARLRPKRV